MINVYLCEDDPKQLQQLEQIINSVIVDHQLEMEISLASQDPHELLERVKVSQPKDSIYVLDIQLHSDISGIQLATQIRDLDHHSKIIFVTTHSELALMVFQYQVEALDFILKDFPNQLYERFSKVLSVAQSRFKSTKNDKNSYVQIKIGETIRSINVNNILFFESSPNPHKLIVHLIDGDLEYYGTLKDVPRLNHNFYRCHKSYVVNLTRIKRLDKHFRQLIMVNDERILCSTKACRFLSRQLDENFLGKKL